MFLFGYGCFVSCSVEAEQLLLDDECSRFEGNTRDECESVTADKAKKMLSEEEGCLIGDSSILIGETDGKFVSGSQVFTSTMQGICDERTENPTEQSFKEFLDLSESESLNTIDIKIFVDSHSTIKERKVEEMFIFLARSANDS